jgi:hypothetical protein
LLEILRLRHCRRRDQHVADANAIVPIGSVEKKCLMMEPISESEHFAALGGTCPVAACVPGSIAPTLPVFGHADSAAGARQ